MEMLEREAKQATTGIREVGVAIWREWSWLVSGDSLECFFFERQLLSLLLSFFSTAPVASRSRCNSDQ